MAFLTNFDTKDLPAYEHAIKKFGGKGRRIRLSIGIPYPDLPQLRSLHANGLRPGDALDGFWALVTEFRKRNS